MGIRGYLAAMAAALLIPLLVLSGFGLERLLRAARASALHHALETARSVSLATDRELARAETTLRVLATSAHLGSRQFAAFHAQAIAALDNNPEAAILLFDDSGRLILTTRRPYGGLSPSEPVHSVLETLRRGRADISGLAQDPDASQLVVMVSVPVTLVANRYVIAHALRASHFQRVLTERKVPSDWIVGVFDRHYLTIARSQRADEMTGEPASELIRRAAASSIEGNVRHPSREGVDIYDVYTRSPRSDWLVAIGVPAERLVASARTTVASALAALAAIVALASGLVFVLGRRLGRSVASVTAAAGAIGRGDPLPSHVSSVTEIDTLRTALEDAHATLESESDARARAEAERLQLFESEQAARQAAEQQNHAKDEFLAMLGHELRNPLSAISGAVALMKLTPAQDEQWAHARDVIGRQTQHLSRVVDDLLDLSRIMTGKVKLDLAPLELAAFAASSLDALCASGRIGPQQVIPKLEPVWVNADATRLEQIIANLLSNAVKYTPRDGRIELRVWPEGNEAVLCVGDTGLGIPAHLLPHVFEVFVQGAQPLDRAKGGLGIGLALVQRLVHLHGGSVTAESAGDSRGSAFTVRLPRLVAPITDATHPARAHRPAPALKVLVVDDHEDSRTMLCMLLEQIGHTALEAVDGIDGVQLALSSRPDVAIIDIGLPGIDGYEVARRLRVLPGGAPAVMIALTGYGQDEDRQRALQAGFDIHLVKPVDPERLTQVLTEAARMRSQHVEGAAPNRTP
jgi:signal transduction histidine kinase/ActR/RegA family two-component response regulator